MSDRIAVTRHPDGVSLTPGEAHYEGLLKDVFALLAEQPELWDDLCDIVAGEPTQQDRYMPAKPAPEDVLAARIVARLAPQSSRCGSSRPRPPGCGTTSRSPRSPRSARQVRHERPRRP